MNLTQFWLSLGLSAVMLTALPAQQGPEKLGELEARLFELEGEKAEFLALVEKAKQAGLAPQLLLEAKFLFFAEHQDEESIAALAKELRAAVEGFDADQSKVFSTLEAYLSVVFYAEALQALGSGDTKGFERAIKEAFWNGPAQAAIFADPIERLRTIEAMQRVQIDLELPFEQQAVDERLSLKSVLNEGKGLVLHFWSPWQRECEVLVPEMGALAGPLNTSGWRTVMVLPQQGEEQLEEASELRKSNLSKSITWLLDRSQGSLASPLRIDRLPLSVILDPNGNVLFHGDTGSEEMIEKLKELDPELKVPMTPEVPVPTETP